MSERNGLEETIHAVSILIPLASSCAVAAQIWHAVSCSEGKSSYATVAVSRISGTAAGTRILTFHGAGQGLSEDVVGDA